MPKQIDRGTPASVVGFGARLKSARKHVGLSLDELGEEAGCPKSNISLAEREIRFPTLLTTVRIAEVLGVRLGWLVSGELPQRGNAVTILVEDDGTTNVGAIRRQLAHQTSTSTAAAGAHGRKARNL
jgi:transcriptional regulator with XRE-family HTH domain